MAEEREFALPPLEERPLVTFALFAYNQEKYIREAVEGAFAQTYEPLEIILSDDCSTDRTFEIMEEMVLGYRGIHKITLNRNDKNLGLIRHFNKLFKIARGEIVVVAGGDDISLPSRVESIASKFLENEKIHAVHSKVLKINDDGIILGEAVPPVIRNKTPLNELTISSSLIIGASAAYRKQLMADYGEIIEILTYEDLIMGFRAVLMGGLSYIDKPLVLYRYGNGLSTSKVSKNPFDRHQVRLKTIEHELATARQRLRDAEALGPDEIKEALRYRVASHEIRVLFYKNKYKIVTSLFGKMAQAIRAVSSEMNYLISSK